MQVSVLDPDHDQNELHMTNRAYSLTLAPSNKHTQYIFNACLHQHWDFMFERIAEASIKTQLIIDPDCKYTFVCFSFDH